MNEITITIPVLGQVDSMTGEVRFSKDVIHAAEDDQCVPKFLPAKVRIGIDRLLKKGQDSE